ncbi:hypothetical protein K443DRAFT_13857 [Laccaria amethystina LaAM-08-1]|uniref:Uncharacterized protein n=1 Tax=Laccaria amethystina LaAM-08-1 TaxID=1095629 RepID=A0A0C9WNN5_9AGAR|nr:hypothetical protein K443DRAFT_13857 [Laccaria amethystina LaAM-08-1]
MSPTAKRVPAALTTAHTILAQRHAALTTWHVNATLRTCHDDERRWLGGGGDAEPLGRPRRSPGERAPAGSTQHNHDDVACHRAQVPRRRPRRGNQTANDDTDHRSSLLFI